MASMHNIERVDIRPGISVLSVLRHLNYKPWFALAEFVDNAIQSSIDRHTELKKIEGKQYVLRVDIEITSDDDGRITIRDNAAGIAHKDFSRAFRPAQVPPNRSGLSEFGMGMKSASCWFSPKWTVRTSAIGEPIERTVTFNIDQIVHDQIEELDVDAQPCPAETHFTEVILSHLHHRPFGRTLGKITDHLTDIYRCFVREGSLVLTLNGDELHYHEPPILEAPFHKDEKGKANKWKTEFDFDFGDGLRAHGFAAIRQVASTARAGFALFRRKRLIEGSGEDGYRPEMIFGSSNSFIYQRVFGEIHLEGFEVSHTKDGFQWDENEQPFLEILKEKLMEGKCPLLQQAREYRVSHKPQDFVAGAEAAVNRTSEVIREHTPDVLNDLCNTNLTEELPSNLTKAGVAGRHSIDIEFRGQTWKIVIEASADPAVGEWLEISEHIAKDEEEKSKGQYRVVGLRVSLVHPFMERFAGTGVDQIEPLLRLAAALGLGEVVARECGVRQAGTIRHNVNELLKDCFWRT